MGNFTSTEKAEGKEVNAQQGIAEDFLFVVAIDLGTTYSGYSFSARDEYKTNPNSQRLRQWRDPSNNHVSNKTSTCILFDPEGEFHSFGFEAEEKFYNLAGENEHADWYYFKSFKMQLYKKNLDDLRELQLTAEDGKTMYALNVFSQSIRYLKDAFLRQNNDAGFNWEEQDIRWVLTVPAIWPEEAISFMRKAADKAGIVEQHLKICLEQEAATIFTYESNQNLFHPGRKFIVVDAGDNVESLLELTPWTWKHVNSSLNVNSPVTVDVSLTSHYRLIGKHLNKLLRIQKQRDCASILKTIPNTKGRDGVYRICPDMKTKKLVYCDMTTDGGGWTVIQRKMNGSVDFNRTWLTYKEGFGQADGDYWLGNDDIHLLTTATKQELRVDVQMFSGKKKYAKYSSFSVASEADKYKLTVGGYSGTAGDSLSHHNGKKFTTKDQDNDNAGGNCAISFESGWWFTDCFKSNLNGRNQKSAVDSWKSIIWHSLGKIALKNARMMIRCNA